MRDYGDIPCNNCGVLYSEFVAKDARIKQLEDALSVISMQTFDNECADCREVQKYIEKALGEDNV